MSRDVSIVFKASDNLSNSIKQMQKNVNGLSRDVSEYRKVQDKAFEKKSEIKFDITKAKKELKELEKAVKQNVEGSEKAFKDKQKSIEQLNEEYRRLTQVAKDASKAEKKLQEDIGKTSKAEKRLQEDISKTSNKNATRSNNNISSDVQNPSIMKSLAGAGLANMLGGAISNNVNYSLTSMFGSTTGSAVGGIVGGVASGAAMGSIAGPIGAAVGAAVGGLTGAINAMTEKQQKDDDVFRDEVKNIYDLTKKEQADSLSNGIGYASRQEQNTISFSTLLKGDDKAEKFLTDIQQFSAVTPFQNENLLNTSKTLLSYGYGQDEITPLMTKVGDAGSALGMSPEDINSIATSLGRMRSSGKTSLDYLNPLIEKGIPVMDYLSKSLGKTQGEVYEMVSKGLIPGAEAAKLIADSMGEQFAGNMEKQSHTYEGLLSTLNDTKAQLDKAMGEGYTEQRKKGMEEEIERLTDPSGVLSEKMKQANNLIGQYKADLENQYQKAILDAQESAMNSDDFLKAEQEGNGAEMGRIIAQARANAETEYKNTEGYALQQKADLDLVKNIQQDEVINGAYNDYGRKMAEQFSKGYSGAIKEMSESGAFTPNEIKSVTNKRGSLWQKFLLNSNNFSEVEDTVKNPNKFALDYINRYATGLDRVPYNNMPAYLHEGERVLTKVEADKFDKGKTTSPIINVTVNNNSGDPYDITKEICNRILRASESYVGG